MLISMTNVLFTKYLNNQTHKNVMGGLCHTHMDRKRNAYRVSVGNQDERPRSGPINWSRSWYYFCLISTGNGNGPAISNYQFTRSLTRYH
jgi:hypothetical protein